MLDGGVIGGLEAGGADEHGDFAIATGFEPVAGGWGNGDIDEDFGGFLEVEGDGGADGADAADFAGVFALGGMIGALDCADDVEAAISAGECD